MQGGRRMLRRLRRVAALSDPERVRLRAAIPVLPSRRYPRPSRGPTRAWSQAVPASGSAQRRAPCGPACRRGAPRHGAARTRSSLSAPALASFLRRFRLRPLRGSFLVRPWRKRADALGGREAGRPAAMRHAGRTRERGLPRTATTAHLWRTIWEPPMWKILALAFACVGLPALAQTTTTVTSEPQQPAAQPPPSSTTTVTTQSQPPPPSSSTQVVVNPSDPGYAPPPPRTTVRSDDEVGGVTTAPSGRSAVAIIATDALYGGVGGALIGAGITLIDQGNNWARNLMLATGIGVLAGAGYGVYEAATQPPPRRAVADRNAAASDTGFSLTATSGQF